MKRISFIVFIVGILTSFHHALAEGADMGSCLKACTSGQLECYMGCIQGGGAGAAPGSSQQDVAALLGGSGAGAGGGDVTTAKAAYDSARADAQKVLDGVNAGTITDPFAVKGATNALNKASEALKAAQAGSQQSDQDQLQAFAAYKQQIAAKKAEQQKSDQAAMIGIIQQINSDQ